MSGCVLNIQRFSLDDGPGVRTTVFFKGCSLRCRWCHNPESMDARPQMLFYSGRCSGCGACVRACPNGARRVTGGSLAYDRTRCRVCGACARACPCGAAQLCGKTAEAREVLEEVLQDRAFYSASGGGVTFSGGEPLCQPEFLAELLELAKGSGLHTAVDTAGHVPSGRFDGAVLRGTDLFLYDLKAIDPGLHQSCTGSDNKLILYNLRRLSEAGKRLWIRLPLMEGLTVTPEESARIAPFLREIRPERVELVPYHSYGEGKYAALGEPLRYQGAPPGREAVRRVQEAFRRQGLEVLCPSDE